MIIVGFDRTEVTRRRLQLSGIRVVELMDIDSGPIDLAVGMSHPGAGSATGRHLIARGYRRFGYVGHDWMTDRRARLRWDGLVHALEEAGLELLIPGFDGAIFSLEWKDALWASFSMEAPRRRRRSVERYNIVKRA